MGNIYQFFLNTIYMLVIFIRTLIIFITLIIVMRLLGKRQIGEMQPFEFIITLIIADLACIPMADVSIPLLYGIVAVLGLFLLHQVIAVLEQIGDGFKKVISGKPSIVINKMGVDLKELKKNNLGVEDLIESMRSAGYFSLDDVEYAIFESNGKLSALQKKEETNYSPSIPLLLVSDGTINKTNLKIIDSNIQEVENFIKQQNVSLKNTEVLTVDGNGRVYFKGKNQKYKILNMPLRENIKW